MPVTVRKTDNELPEDLRHDADSGPVILPRYTALNREDWKRPLSLIPLRPRGRDKMPRPGGWV
jgi:hypothetical protein